MVDEIQKLPVLHKSEYRAFTDSLFEANPEKYNRWYLDGTSGATGTPLKIYRMWSERAYMLAKYLRAMFLNGYRITDTTFCLPSPHRLAKGDSLVQTLGLMRRYSVSYTAPVQEMVEGYIRANPDYLYANKSQLVEMGLYIQKLGISISRPRLYLSAAETMDENSKRVIEDVFGSENLFQVYGAVEFNTLAFQTKGQDWFHFNHDTNILELENDGKLDVNQGNCIITDLHIQSMPLIRYKLGDWLETANIDGLTVIKRIRGRLDDWVTFRDGSRKPFHAFYEVMERRAEVLKFRIVQETYDLIRVLIVPQADADVDFVRQRVVKDMLAEVRDDVNFKVEFVESIPPDPSGKLRMIISKVT